MSVSKRAQYRSTMNKVDNMTNTDQSLTADSRQQTADSRQTDRA